jgi:hypothetical protein
VLPAGTTAAEIKSPLRIARLLRDIERAKKLLIAPLMVPHRNMRKISQRWA